jgi:hypothetical protein
MRYVLVRWQDATMEGGWHDKEYASHISGAQAVSVGFLIAEDGDWLKLAQTTSHNEDGNLLEIPKRWITSFEELGEVDVA